jgi:hypothetical protein
MLWQLGTETVDRIGLASLQNCAFINIVNPMLDYPMMFDMLMLGTGVGFRITSDVSSGIGKVFAANIEHKRTNDADFIVPDSREGWCELTRRVMQSHFDSTLTRRDFSYSTIVLRERGAPITAFGGVASGYQSLCSGIADISDMLNAHAGNFPTDTVLLDIGNKIGEIVVSGNVRRSALLAAGDATDSFITAKNWEMGDIPACRAFSNLSLICDDITELPDSYWDSFRREGEVHGLLNLKLMRSCGRLGETMYRDPRVEGVNPCAEQTLEDGETCCLSEIFLPNIESKQELQDCIITLYRICKHVMMLPCHYERVDRVIKKNFRMGLGVTGVMESSEEQLKWLEESYDMLRKYDNEYSDRRGIPRSIKLTSVKPSGTLSLIAGITSPGIHPSFSKYFKRRVRLSSTSPLVDVLRSMGYHVEFVKTMDGRNDPTTMVVAFPVKARDGAKLATEVTAVSQMEMVKRLQTIWSDNSVSCTVYFRDDEVDEIKAWLMDNYNMSVKSISFLRHSEHGFQQAPLEEISEEAYDKLMAKIHITDALVDRMTMFKVPTDIAKEMEEVNEMECATGACPIR